MENINDIKKQYKLRDRVVRAISDDGFFRIAVVKNTKSAITAQEKHNLSSIPSIFLSRQLAASTLMASFLKGQERIVLEVESDGKIQKIYSEALQLGEIRGFIDYDSDIESFNAESIYDYLAGGALRVIKILYNTSEPFIGVVPLVKGDLATDLAYYYRQSEQIPTAVVLDASVDNNGKIKQSGGILLQALPGAKTEDIEIIYKQISQIGLLADLFENEEMPEDIVKKIFHLEYKILNDTPIDFFCRCSKDNFKQKLLTLGLSEIRDMKQKNENELVCRYCNNKYFLDESDFNWIIETIQATKN